ncbi:hypothetical protein K431DRAFT_30725 [Polychaeton citri CBS 116435]|uniref:Uncharacterized protein n=1 Tax=Polychaeton citri CBS 116435 TaxID=1314669 RepID=A0A9P4Q9E1_9PEZI|nr:hypothetical protein K431DRAFT_30725 [Polychaeton citri CBS 116435]
MQSRLAEQMGQRVDEHMAQSLTQIVLASVSCLRAVGTSLWLHRKALCQDGPVATDSALKVEATGRVSIEASKSLHPDYCRSRKTSCSIMRSRRLQSAFPSQWRFCRGAAKSLLGGAFWQPIRFSSISSCRIIGHATSLTECRSAKDGW